MMLHWASFASLLHQLSVQAIRGPIPTGRESAFGGLGYILKLVLIFFPHQTEDFGAASDTDRWQGN